MTNLDILNSLNEDSYLYDKEVNSLINEIEGFRKKTPITSQGLQILSKYRILSSSTLMHQQSLETWDKANQWIYLNLHSPLNVEALSELNSILSKKKSQLRKTPVFSGPWQYLESAYLEKAFLNFIEYIDNINSPLLKACEIYIWIITMHPFEDANGRTSRLLADRELLRNNYLPLSFDSNISSFVANVIDGEYRSKKENIIKTLKAILRSYQVITPS